MKPTIEQKNEIGIYKGSGPILDEETKKEIEIQFRKCLEEKTETIMNLAYDEVMKVLTPRLLKINSEIEELKKKIADFYGEVSQFDLDGYLLKLNELKRRGISINQFTSTINNNYKNYVAKQNNENKRTSFKNKADYIAYFDNLYHKTDLMLDDLIRQKTEQKGNYYENEEKYKNIVTQITNQINELTQLYQNFYSEDEEEKQLQNSQKVDYQTLYDKTVKSLDKIRAEYSRIKKQNPEDTFKEKREIFSVLESIFPQP